MASDSWPWRDLNRQSVGAVQFAAARLLLRCRSAAARLPLRCRTAAAQLAMRCGRLRFYCGLGVIGGSGHGPPLACQSTEDACPREWPTSKQKLSRRLRCRSGVRRSSGSD
jgi:hypothetical protein